MSENHSPPIVISSSEVIHARNKGSDKEEFYDHVTLEFENGRFGRVHVGDTVALACDTSSKEKTETWKPWKEKWSAVQVLAIYQNKGQFNITFRFFWRPCEFKKGMRKKLKGLPQQAPLLLKHVVETDEVRSESLDKILGLVSVKSQLGKGGFRAAAKTCGAEALMLCTSFVRFQVSKYSTVNDWGLDQEDGRPSPCVERGIDLLTDGMLVQELMPGYVNCVAERDVFDPNDYKKSKKGRANNKKAASTAKKSTAEPAPKKKVSNSAAKQGSNKTENKQSKEASVKPTQKRKASTSGANEASTKPNKKPRKSAAPASSVSRTSVGSSVSKNTRRPIKKQKSSAASVVSLSSSSISTKTAKTIDREYSDDSQKGMSSSGDQSVVSEDARLTEAESRVSLSGAPLHADKSSLRVYYTEMMIEPPFPNYHVSGKNECRLWKVQVGDVVAIQCESGSGKTPFGVNVQPKSNHFPFTAAWAVGEIVCIWKEYKSESNFTAAMRNKGKKQVGDLELEIRWFWRKSELTRGASKTSDHSIECEELFETDQIERCSASSCLAPVKLCPVNTSLLSEEVFDQGMPVVQFKCTKVWSFHRKSIIPFASQSGRLARSRMYSLCLSKDTLLLGKLEAFQGSNVSRTAHDSLSDVPASCWKQSFEDVVSNLSLTQASEDVFVTGAGLVGREKEQKEITDFLSAAIKGAHNSEHISSAEGSRQPSLFVAGPPGTGKSVSVCSIIAKLRHKQALGKVPDFDFISLNGMEMRHPYDAYVQFWEAISGSAKERVPPEVAAGKLERYFSGMDVKGAPKRSVIVLMLDEIDYLVTKKQTVLYNFFDWPKRSFQTPKCPRLIVVGISNTVNLPSSLKPSVRSRLGGCRCDFKSYNAQDIIQILKSKIQPKASNYQVFDVDAIVFAAKKIAAVTGDIRKALQTCKAAAECVLQEVENGKREDPKGSADRPVVRIKDIQKVTKEKIGIVMSNAIAAAAPLEALILVSLASLTRHSGRQSGGFDITELMDKATSVANTSGSREYAPAPSFHETINILNRLAESRLVRLHTEKSSAYTFRASQGGGGGAWPAIALNLDDSDILSSLREGPHSRLANKELTTGSSLLKTAYGLA